jgi:phosphoribosyl 1,2-cyclic phosphodiesterase
MAVQFAVLASGSRGNATLIRSSGAGLLLDLGVGPRELTRRLESVGASWSDVATALLTHTHGDHVDEHSLQVLADRRIPFYCHEMHREELSYKAGFRVLDGAGLVRTYDDRPFLAPTGMQVEPLELRHDSDPTFGFRVEARAARRGRPVAIGYMADTGTWTEPMADLLAGVDLLGVEFNHDVMMQRQSRRPPFLIERVLGDWGHLSNEQGADFVSAVLGRSERGDVRHVVLLHLSEQCNRPELALKSARAAVRGSGRRATVHAARQRAAHPAVWLEPARRSRRPATATAGSAAGPIRKVAQAASWFNEPE